MTLSFLQILRPKQWIKNFLVFIAPFAAGVSLNSYLIQFRVFITFCICSSIGYVLNDWVDRKLDAKHPKKNQRPFASNKLSFTHFILLEIVLLSVLVFLIKDFSMSLILAVTSYLLITFSYSFFIKNILIFEIVWISIGFLVRAISGGIALSIPISSWFLIFIGFASIFIVTAKRLNELNNKHLEITRKNINLYPEKFLITLLTSSMAICLITYTLWIFEVYPTSITALLTIFFVTLIFYYYTYFFETSKEEKPEEILFTNYILITNVLIVVVLLFLTIYLKI